MYPTALILVDGPRFTRVIANFVSNALKFTPKGGKVKVLATVLPAEPSVMSLGKYRLRIAVTDTGAGISKVQ